MKLIPQDVVDNAASIHAKEYVDFDESYSIAEEDLIAYTIFDFKRGVVFAESKLKDLFINFLNSIRNYETVNRQIICVDEREPKELFEIFIKEIQKV